MDMKMQAFLDKVKDMADKTGKVSRHAAGVAGKKANDLALATRINLQIFDLNTECEALYKEIGKLVYDLHRGAEAVSYTHLEVQIRTVEMHKMAEYGVAAHWKYKQGLDKKGNEEAFAWIRQLLEAQQDTEAEDFIKNIKVCLLYTSLSGGCGENGAVYR